VLQLRYQLGYLVIYQSAEKVNLLRVKQCACNCSQLLIVFRPFLVLSLNSLFVSVLEVIEFVLDCMEKSIEGIANILWGKREFEDIGDSSINILFEEGENWKVEPGPLGVEALLIFGHSSVVDQSVVVEEESAGDVEGDEDVNAVVLMGGKDEEDAEAVEQPGKRVQEVDPTTRVLRDEEVQQGQGHGVSREHVVAASPDPLQRHTSSGPDDIGVSQPIRPVAIRSWLAV